MSRIGVLLAGVAIAGFSAWPASGQLPRSGGTGSKPTGTKAGTALADKEVGESVSLRSLAEQRGIHVGAAVVPAALNGVPGIMTAERCQEVLAEHFNLVVPEFQMKWEYTEPMKGADDWEPFDQLVDFAQTNGMQVKGHVFGWHAALPAWVKELPTQKAKTAALHERIRTVMARYKGRVQLYDVVNEAIGPNGRGFTSTPEWTWAEADIEAAFRVAHEADPDAILIYNDIHCEDMGPKSTGQYQLLKRLLARGVPVYGVGLQMHIFHAGNPRPSDVQRNVRRLAALGLKVYISEMDVKYTTMRGNSEDEKLEAQSEVYRSILNACVNEPGFAGVTFWGYWDECNWLTAGNRRAAGQRLGRYPNEGEFVKERPLLFDFQMEKKPAFFAVQEALSPHEKASSTR